MTMNKNDPVYYFQHSRLTMVSPGVPQQWMLTEEPPPGVTASWTRVLQITPLNQSVLPPTVCPASSRSSTRETLMKPALYLM